MPKLEVGHRRSLFISFFSVDFALRFNLIFVYNIQQNAVLLFKKSVDALEAKLQWVESQLQLGLSTSQEADLAALINKHTITYVCTRDVIGGLILMES